MKIVHLNTADFRGGASKMVYRLHHGLRRLGVDSSYHVRKKLTRDESVEEVGGQEVRLAERVVKKHLIDRKRSALTTSPFTFTWDAAGGSFFPGTYASMDVVHLHWVERFLSPAELLGLVALGRPLLWTVHDQKPATGGCHWSYDCREFERDCNPCNQLAEDPFALPARVLAMKRSIFAGADLTLAAPSSWMAGILRESRLFQDKDVRVIPHGIETDVFSGGGRAGAKEQCGIAPGRKTLLFTAYNTEAHHKGLRYVVETLKICRRDARFESLRREGRLELLVVGKTSEDFASVGVPVRTFGYVESRQELAGIFRAADILINPTLAESFSLVSLEAMACGVAVAGFRTGGMPDFIDKESGELVAPRNSDALAGAVLRLLSDDDWRRKVSAAAEKRAGAYTIARMGKAYRELYDELRQRTCDVSAPDPGELDGFRDLITRAALLEVEEILGATCLSGTSRPAVAIGSQRGSLRGGSEEKDLADCLAEKKQQLLEKEPDCYRKLASLAQKL